MPRDKRDGDNPNAALDAASDVLRAELTDAEDEAYQAAMDRLTRYGGDLRGLLAAAAEVWLRRRAEHVESEELS